MTTIVRIEEPDLEELAILSQELCGRETNITCLKENFEKIVRDPNYLLIGAKDARNRLIGSVMGIICMDFVGECRPFVVMENLIVDEKARGLGVGKLLVSYIEDRARERNCFYLTFTSLAIRTEAHAFYEGIGYPKGMVEGFKKYL